MKVAVVYNRESKSVINLFGRPNKEKIGQETINRLLAALREGGHQAVAYEGDKDLVDKLEEFMPRVVKGERPGMVFNVSYGIQGQARYTHVPSILEMVGIPYVASGPLAHSLSLDKVVTKMILRQHGLPTPDFAVLDAPDAEIPELTYPMIVKPKNEAVSFGLKIVNDEAELREAAGVIFEEFRQPVLVEQYIEGREVNVGLLGNDPPEAFPPVELIFPKDGPAIYTYQDKTGRSGRTISHEVPAPIGDELNHYAQEIAIKAFTCLGCADCARVDMRLGADGKLYILEINSLPSLGEHGSYLIGADAVGLDFPKFVNRLVEVASARYFGTPEPPSLEGGEVATGDRIFEFVTQRRDRMEKRLRDWASVASHTPDPVGVREAVRRADRLMEELKLERVDELTDERSAYTWQSRAGLDDGTLLVAHLDVPGEETSGAPRFRREPEWLYGDGIGSSRAPLVMLEFALRALRSQRRLQKAPLGVLLYTDEGRDARYSAEIIRSAIGRAARVLVLRPSNVADTVITQRRGQRTFRFRAEADPLRFGRATKKKELLRWFWNQLETFTAMSNRKERISVSVVHLGSERLPLNLPHRAHATVLLTYPSSEVADGIEKKMRAAVEKGGPRWELERIADRPAMTGHKKTVELAGAFAEAAKRWEIEIKPESSMWASVAGLAPPDTACLCGVGPVVRDLGTPHEAVKRISLVQRTLLLAQFLGEQGK